MVFCLGKFFHYLGFSKSIEDGAENNLLKKISRDQTGTGESSQHAPRPNNLESEEVKVFISPGSFLYVRAGMDKFRWIKDHHIELLPLITEYPEEVKGVALYKVIILCFQAVESQIFPGQG